MGETPSLRWFDEIPKCPCGKLAQGRLMGERNDSYGWHCKNVPTSALRHPLPPARKDNPMTDFNLPAPPPPRWPTHWMPLPPLPEHTL